MGRKHKSVDICLNQLSAHPNNQFQAHILSSILNSSQTQPTYFLGHHLTFTVNVTVGRPSGPAKSPGRVLLLQWSVWTLRTSQRLEERINQSEGVEGVES